MAICTLHLNPASGLISPARQLASPNHNQRPDNEISLLVIHNISLPPDEFGTGMVDALFTNQLPSGQHPFLDSILELRVSAHFFIERCGQLTQFVSCNDRAWHAGQSSFQGRSHCNDFSIGIELEGTDTQPFTDLQYQTLTALVTELMHHYPQITPARICGHSDIAPGRKTDPGPFFNWQRVLKLCGKAHSSTADKPVDKP